MIILRHIDNAFIDYVANGEKTPRHLGVTPRNWGRVVLGDLGPVLEIELDARRDTEFLPMAFLNLCKTFFDSHFSDHYPMADELEENGGLPSPWGVQRQIAEGFIAPPNSSWRQLQGLKVTARLKSEFDPSFGIELESELSLFETLENFLLVNTELLNLEAFRARCSLQAVQQAH